MTRFDRTRQSHSFRCRVCEHSPAPVVVESIRYTIHAMSPSKRHLAIAPRRLCLYCAVRYGFDLAILY